MKYTTHYNLAYFEDGDQTSAHEEHRRWEIIDREIKGIYDAIGDGVISGWEVSLVDDNFQIAAGEGIVNNMFVKTSGTTKVKRSFKEKNFIFIESYFSLKNEQIVNFVCSDCWCESDGLLIASFNNGELDCSKVRHFYALRKMKEILLPHLNNAVKEASFQSETVIKKEDCIKDDGLVFEFNQEGHDFYYIDSEENLAGYAQYDSNNVAYLIQTNSMIKTHEGCKNVRIKVLGDFEQLRVIPL